MIGSEIVPVVKAAATAGKAALSDDDVKKELLELAKESPLLKSAAEKYAQRVAVKQAILLKLYQPLARILGVAREYFDDDFAREMAEKTAHIPEERLTTPAASVAVPAMQGLSYSLDEPDLKEMYLNLLATATDASVSEQAHPSFSEIIKQLSAAEARLLLNVLDVGLLPIVRLRRKPPEGPGAVDALSHLLDIRDAAQAPREQPSLPVWIDNWIRLGLIEVDYSRHLVEDTRYAWVEDRPEFIRLQDLDERGAAAIETQKGIAKATDFGARFAKAVSPPEETVVVAEPGSGRWADLDESPDEGPPAGGAAGIS